jgi:hypothetical protein
MDGRLIANCTTATSGIISLGALLGKHIGFPWISEALRLFNMAGVSNISWDGIWLIVFVASVVTASFLNFKNLSIRIQQWREDRKRHWNMNVCDALNYISDISHFGMTWPQDKRHKFSTGSLYEAARSGIIELAGLPPGSLIQVKIPQHWFNGETILDTKYCTRVEMKNVFLTEKDGKTVIFSSLFADEKQIENTWPPRPISRRV